MNINFTWKKFELLEDQVKDNINILLISEKKTDVTFSNSDFLVEGFSILYRLDRDSNDGGILLYPPNVM